ncbi:hypothetical protein JCM16303_005472 [Sporobolomyces ruberrimus]
MSRLRWVERRERQVALFQPETPSRVLRRIEDLDQQLLPDLPGLPLAADQTTFSEDYEDGDSTIASSPPRTSSTKTRLDQSTTTSSPYTSTPAPASSIDHTTTSTRYSRGDDTASTARPPPPPQLASLGKSLNRSQQRQNEIESSYDDTMSEIGKRGNEPSFGQDDEEDMILLSGASGGEESEREATGHELSELSVPQALVEETTVEEQTTREEAESSFEEERHPLDALGEMGSKQDARLDQPVVSSVLSALDLRPTFERLTLSSQESTQKEKPILPSTLSPLRERDTNSTTFASPELGRNYSPRHSQHSLQDSLLSDQTPSRNGDKTPTSSLTPTRLGTPTLDSPLHSLHQDSNPATPLVSQTDAARRANHLLTTLRSTAKPRFTRGTPHPLRSVQKQPSSSATSALPHDQDDQRSTTTSSSFASDHSSNDLTTFHPKANTSLPSGGTADVGGSAAIGGGSRFNGAKLNAYLHQLNTHLTEENQNLVKTLKKTTDDNEKLQYTIREMSVAGGVSVDVSGSSKWRKRTNSSNSGEDGEGDNSRVEELGIELEGLVDGQRKIRGLQDRFGGELGRGKDAATKIRELEEELERAREQLGNKDDEIHQLREQVVSSKTASSSNGGGRDESSANLVSDLQQEVFDLKDALDTASSERDTAQADLAKLETDFTAAGQASEKDFANLQARIEELLEDLQEKDVEVDAVKQLLVDQETEFAEKMEELEKELSKVMEEQEKKVEAARDELDLKSREDEMARKGDKEALERIKAERDALEQRLEKEGKALDEALEEEILSLKRGIETRDEELNRMQEELEAAEGTGGDVEELRRQIKAKDEEIQQLEGALDESASQLLQNEDDLAALRQQLASEKQVNSSLSAQISQFSVVKARSPLGNEVFNSDKDDDIASLEEELEEARQEIVQLHEKLASNANEDRSAELRDLEIQNLETTKADLEDRVKSLRQQVSIQFSPSQTPDKSWLLRPLPAVRTPKTPGQFLSNLSNWSPGSAANETISPLLAQIHELEQMVEHLQTQLVAANAQIDNKLDRLEAAGFDTISIARQLSTAQTRIAELEGQLERLLGENGSIERVRARLTKVKCPDCTTTFDANKVVQLRVDQGGISFEGFTTQGKAVDSLRSDLALAHAKLDELRIEANVLRSQAARSKELSGDKSTLLAQQDALSKDLQQARNEIVVLETDLRTERSRLRTLTSDHAVSEKAKAALESRITGLETELRKTARTAAGSSPEVDSLRSALATKEAEQRRLQDERGDILRGVANLQADMNRVRQEAVSLGLDLAGVRRERDEFAKKQAGEKILQTLESKSLEELRARHKQESKGLLVLVRQLKLRVNREVQFRYLAGEQKDYLSSVVREKQATIDSIMSQLNLPLPSQQASRPTLRSAALAVCALSRMRRLSQQWKEDSVPKKRLREQAYPEVRGKPFPS